MWGKLEVMALRKARKVGNGVGLKRDAKGIEMRGVKITRGWRMMGRVCSVGGKRVGVKKTWRIG